MSCSFITSPMFCFQLTSLLHSDAHLWCQFSCCCCQHTPWWCLLAPSSPNCLTWITAYPVFTKFRRKTLQHQLRLVLRFPSRAKTKHCRTKIIIWHDVIDKSLAPHSSNFNRPLSQPALLQELCALLCDIAAIVYCQHTGSPDVFVAASIVSCNKPCPPFVFSS